MITTPGNPFPDPISSRFSAHGGSSETNIIESRIPNDLILGHYITIQKGVTIGRRTRICNFVNLYGCTIGEECVIGPFVEVQAHAVIGDQTRIGSHSFVCSNVTIGQDCFIAHGVMFSNDNFKGRRVHFDAHEWECASVGDHTIIASNVVLLPVKVGRNCVIGAGAVVTNDVPDHAIVWGNPATIQGYR